MKLKFKKNIRPLTVAGLALVCGGVLLIALGCFTDAAAMGASLKQMLRFGFFGH